MKKIAAPLAVLLLIALLAACSAATPIGDREKRLGQAFNQASDAYNELTEIVNQKKEINGEVWEDVQALGAMLRNYKKVIEEAESFSIEEMDSMIAWLESVPQTTASLKARLG